MVSDRGIGTPREVVYRLHAKLKPRPAALQLPRRAGSLDELIGHCIVWRSSPASAQRSNGCAAT
jgi:hypothetical protein